MGQSNSLGNVYRTIYTSTLESAASPITVSTDVNGSAFSLQEAEILLMIPACAAANTVQLQLNGITGSYYANTFSSTTALASYLYACTSGTTKSTAFIQLRVVGGDVLSTQHYVKKDTNIAMGNYTGGLWGRSVTGITSIKLSLSGNFPIGTTIIIRGK